jgi:hypothetical protein
MKYIDLNDYDQQDLVRRFPAPLLPSSTPSTLASGSAPGRRCVIAITTLGATITPMALLAAFVACPGRTTTP